MEDSTHVEIHFALAVILRYILFPPLYGSTS